MSSSNPSNSTSDNNSTPIKQLLVAGEEANKIITQAKKSTYYTNLSLIFIIYIHDQIDQILDKLIKFRQARDESQSEVDKIRLELIEHLANVQQQVKLDLEKKKVQLQLENAEKIEATKQCYDENKNDLVQFLVNDSLCVNTELEREQGKFIEKKNKMTHNL